MADSMVDLPAPATPWTATIRSWDVSASVAAASCPALSCLAPAAAIDLAQDPGFGRERARSRDVGHDIVDAVRHPGHQPPGLQELGDARVDLVGCHAGKPKAERGMAHLGEREGGFTLLKDPHGGSDRSLGADVDGGKPQALEAAINERVRSREHAAEPLADVG
jgi:hypothetical protein